MSFHFAQPGWESTLLAGQSLVPLLPLEEMEADRAAAIFDRLHLPDVPGQPTFGEAAGDWFRDVVRALFGSLDRDTGIRHVPGVFLLVPKKNSKTTNGAALMLTALLMNERPNAAFALFGPTQEIADMAFDAVAGMVAADKDLDTLLHVRHHVKTVVNRVTGATLKVMTFDMKVATGGKYAGWLLDELHLLGKMSYTARVIGQLRGARAAIKEAFGVIITTQSDEPPAGAFKAELDYARGVRDGRIQNGTVLPVLYEFPEEMQTDAAKPWRDVSNWPLVLPNLGRSVSLPVLEQDYAMAREMGDEEERRWASQHLNIQIGLALHSNRWEGADFWEHAGNSEVTLDWILANCEVCTVGIDGGGLDDLLGLGVLGRHAETKRWYHWGHAWADRGVLLLRKEIAPRLNDFVEIGDLTLVDIAETADGANADVSGVADVVERIYRAGLLPEKAGIGVDSVGIAAILDELALRGIPDGCIAAVPQGYRLSGVIKGAARKLKDGTLKHGARPMMAWCVGNCRSELKGSAVLVTKQASGTAKIDPVIGLFNAFDLMSRNPEAAGDDSLDGYLASLRGAA